MNEIKLWWNLAKYSIKWSVLGLTALDYLKELGPSAVDSEIRCLGPDAGGSVTVMCQFLDMISYVLDTKKDFEISNAYLGLFLKVIIMLIYFSYMNYNSINLHLDWFSDVFTLHHGSLILKCYNCQPLVKFFSLYEFSVLSSCTYINIWQYFTSGLK